MAGRERRVVLPREDPIAGLSDAKIRKAYRFTRQGIHFLVDLLEEDLRPRSNKNKPLSAVLQLCIALMYYAGGSLLYQIARAHRVSNSSASRSIRKVTLALVRRRSQFIIFPTKRQQAERTKREFYDIAGFPNVLGAVDCTHVGLNGSVLGDREHLYVNRKFRHSINVQMVCNASYVITNVVARWPGSTHDSRILKMSHLGRHLHNGRQDGVLLGDSGYPLRRWIQTPFGPERDDTPAKRAYNRAHIRTRCLIEMTFGQLKNKFRCLRGHGMQMSPRRVCDIIVACSVLFNIAKRLNEPMEEEEDLQQAIPEDAGNEIEDEDHDDINYHIGQMVRMDIVNGFFQPHNR